MELMPEELELNEQGQDKQGLKELDLSGLDRIDLDRIELDLRELEILGGLLDWRPARLKGPTTAEFLAEVLLRVRGKDGRLTPLRGNAAQRAYEQRRGVGNIVLKARQMGLTTWVAGRFLLKTVCRPGTLTLQVAHTQEAAEEMFAIVHRFVDNLPAGLAAGALRRSKSSVRQIVFPEIDSEYRVVSAADRNAGRGMTYQNLHCSEVARWGDGGGDAAEVLAGLRAGLAPGGEQVLESTPNGTGGCFYEEWQRAEESGLVRHFFPWWLEDGYRGAAVDEATLTEEELELMTRPEVQLSLEQIGFRRRTRSSLARMARQEFVEEAETCFLLSGEPYFEMDAVEKRLAEVGAAPLHRYNGRLEVWFPPVAGKRYVVAVDPAGGGAEGDFSAIQVLDIETGLQCAEFAGHVGGLELMELARQVGWDYNTAWLAVERNNHGSGLLCLLEEKGYREIFKAADGQLGYLTTSVSRPAMLARMSAALVEEPRLFQSKKLLVECRSFVRLTNGSVGARSGAHDDRVMAMAVGLAARVELLGRRRQGSGRAG
jgi:hypothetical protein